MVSEQTLGEMLSEAFGGRPLEGESWEVIEAAIDLIAGHYWLDRWAVFDAVWEIEAELRAESGLDCFGHALERPWGISTLGVRVAQKLLGEEEAAELSPILLSYH